MGILVRYINPWTLLRREQELGNRDSRGHARTYNTCYIGSCLRQLHHVVCLNLLRHTEGVPRVQS